MKQEKDKKKLCAIVSQSWKGEFMGFYEEAVRVLETLVRALCRPDFFSGLYLGDRQERHFAGEREMPASLVRVRRIHPPIRAEP